MVEKEMMVKIQNVTEGPEKYVVARYGEDNKLWYYGRWEHYSDACEVADEINGIVVKDVGGV